MIKLHPESIHRQRQIRWVLGSVGLAFISVLVALAVMYFMSAQKVETEFWHAHKQVSHTGDLLWQGALASAIAMTVMAALVALWRFRVTNRIVRPIYLMHRALDELVAGNLGVRLQLKHSDEFHEVAQALNKLVEEFGDVLGKLHPLVDQMESLAVDVAKGASTADSEARLHAIAQEINQTMDFFRLTPTTVIQEEP